MPKILDECVSRLVNNPKFRARTEGQSKKAAATAVCNFTLKKAGKLSFDSEIHDKILTEIENDAVKGIVKLSTGDVAPLKLTGEGKPPKEFELLRVGTFKHRYYGDMVFTKDILDDFVTSFDARLEAKGPNREDNALPINESHNSGGKAFGWIHGLKRKGERLMATEVEWTELGIEALSKKFYKYTSAELNLGLTYRDLKTGEKFLNVITGAALTNIPYMQILTPVTFSNEISNNKNKNNKESTMELSKIIAKKVTELSVAEIAFLKENKKDLSEDSISTFASVLEDKKEIKKDTKLDQTMTQVSKVELAQLKATADKVLALEEKENARELSEFVGGLMLTESNKEGKFEPVAQEALTALAATLSEDQKALFTTFVELLPKKELFTEQGDAGENIGTEDALDNAVKKCAKENKLSYSDALTKVSLENPELVKNYK